MILIVGLGNFGSLYVNTYHNMGFMATDMLANFLGEKFKSSPKLDAKTIEANIGGEKVIIAQPTTYMNNSGIAVQKICAKFKIPHENVYVVYDDIDLPAGKLRFRTSGSGGTHNGMRSVVEFNGEDVKRIRIGVGKPEKANLRDFVVSKIKPEVKEVLNPAIRAVANALQSLVETKSEGEIEKLNSYA